MEEHAQLLLRLKHARQTADAAVRERKRTVLRAAEIAEKLRAAPQDGVLRNILAQAHQRIAELDGWIVVLETERQRAQDLVERSRSERNVGFEQVVGEPDVGAVTHGERGPAMRRPGTTEPGAPPPGVYRSAPMPGSWVQPMWGVDPSE